MLKYCAAGWKMTLWNPFLIFSLFLYQLLWGLFLYRFVQSVVVPLLHRYPGEGMTADLQAIFAAESRFRLMKTDLADPYLWTLAAVFVVRMALTPVLNAGIYHSIQQTHVDGKRSFLEGVRRWSFPFFWLYLGQTALSFAPLLWLIPRAGSLTEELFLEGRIDAQPALLAACYLAYTVFVKLAAMYAQFGLVAGTGRLRALKLLLMRFPKAAALSALILGAYALVAVLGAALSIAAAGLAAVVLYQTYHLIKAVFKLWEIGAQHQYFAAATR
jgi:hypothetical protein